MCAICIKKGIFSKFRGIRGSNSPKQHVNLKFLERENAKNKFKKGVASGSRTQ